MNIFEQTSNKKCSSMKAKYFMNLAIPGMLPAFVFFLMKKSLMKCFN